MSRQAEIFKRRHTQQSSSVENGATSAPQTTHGVARLAVLAAGFFARGARGLAVFFVMGI
jgi:hypothetical protein